MKTHQADAMEIGYDLILGTKEYFCKNCQKLIGIQTSPEEGIIWDTEYYEECKKEA